MIFCLKSSNDFQFPFSLGDPSASRSTSVSRLDPAPSATNSISSTQTPLSFNQTKRTIPLEANQFAATKSNHLSCRYFAFPPKRDQLKRDWIGC